MTHISEDRVQRGEETLQPRFSRYTSASTTEVRSMLMCSSSLGAHRVFAGEAGLRCTLAAWLLQPKRLAITASASGDAHVWSVDLQVTEDPIFRLAHGSPVFAARLATTSGLALTASRDGTVKIWSVFSCCHPVSEWCCDKGIVCLDADLDRDRLLTSSVDGACRLWALASGELLRTFLQENSPLSVVLAPCPDGTAQDFTALSGSWPALKADFTAGRVVFARGGAAVIHDCGAGAVGEPSRKEPIVLRHLSKVTCVALDAAQRLVVTGSRDRTAAIWSFDAHCGRRLCTFDVTKGGPVTAVALDPAGIILTGSRDGIVRVWSLDGHLLGTHSHQGCVTDVGFG